MIFINMRSIKLQVKIKSSPMKRAIKYLLVTITLVGGLFSAVLQAENATPNQKTAINSPANLNPFAAPYPAKPIKILVGYSAGGAVDLVARALAQTITTSLNQTVIVENKPGAGTNIAVKQLVDSPPDGYTLMLVANALAANTALYKPKPYDLDKDITPIALIGHVPVVIATRGTSSITSLAEMIKLAKASPARISYGTPGNGSTPHMAMKLFEQEAGVALQHIPYKGGASAITDLIGGQLDLVAVNLLEVAPQVAAGKLRIVASMNAQRTASFADVPTVAESGYPKFEASVWYGLIAPAKVDPQIIKVLHTQVQAALGAREFRERLSLVGGEVSPQTTDFFKQFLNNERLRYEKIVAIANIAPD